MATEVGNSAELVGETCGIVLTRDPGALAAGWQSSSMLASRGYLSVAL